MPDHRLPPLVFRQALKNGHYAKVIKALSAGQDIKASPFAHPDPRERYSPLAEMWCWARPGRAMEVVELLLAGGADPNAPDQAGRQPLHTWLWLTNAPKQAIQRLVHAGAKPFTRSVLTPGNDGATAVEACLFKGVPHKIAWLTEIIPDLGTQHDDFREDPILRRAVRNLREDRPEHRQALLTLLDAGAGLDATDKFGRCARHELLGYQVGMVAQWENERQARLDAQTLEQSTPRVDGFSLRRM